MMISSVLILGVNTAFKQVLMVNRHIKEQRDIYHKSRIFFDTIRTELSCMYIPKSEKTISAFSLKSSPDTTVEMSFYTLNPIWQNSAVSSYPAKLTYYTTADAESNAKTLCRSEQLCSGEKNISTEHKEIILSGLCELEIFTTETESNTWQDNLNCQDTLPKAVKIYSRWLTESRRKIEFQTIITIPCCQK